MEELLDDEDEGPAVSASRLDVDDGADDEEAFLISYTMAQMRRSRAPVTARNYGTSWATRTSTMTMTTRSRNMRSSVHSCMVSTTLQ
jgi:hypothetical protein